MKIHLCNPIGPSLGYPECEIPRLSAFLKSKGYQVKAYDLRIKVLMRLKKFLLPSAECIEAYSVDITRQYDFLPRDLKIYQAKDKGFCERYLFEEMVGRMEYYILAIAQFYCFGAFNKRLGERKFLKDIDLSEIKALVDEEIEVWLKRLVIDKFDLIGFSIFPRKYYELLEKRFTFFQNFKLVELLWCIILARMIKKERDVPIWISCNYPRESVYKFANTFKIKCPIDFFIFDDSEETLLDYLERFKRKVDVSSVRGTIIKTKNKYISNSSRGMIKPLDKLPLPDYSDIPLHLYKKFFGRKIISIRGSIGCTENCSFCSPVARRKEYIARSPEHISQEIITLKGKYDIDLFIFEDRLININIEKLERLCNLLISSDLDLHWIGYAKISPLITKKLLKKMHTSGCRKLIFGIESGSPKILKKMKKGFTLKQASQLLRDTFQNHIETVVQLMTDFPGEGKKELNETIDFIRNNCFFISQFRVNSFSFYPGSDLALNKKEIVKIINSQKNNMLKLIESCKKISESEKDYRGESYLFNTETKNLESIDCIHLEQLLLKNKNSIQYA